MRSIGWLAYWMVGLLAGCGYAAPTHAPQLAPAASSEPAIGIPIPGYGLPADPGSAPAASDSAADLLRASGRALMALHTASYEGEMYCRGSRGNKPAVLPIDHGEWEATSVYQLTYRAPGTYHIDVTSCTNPRSVGMKMRLVPDHVEVRLPGILGFVTLSMGYDDARIQDFRGNRVDADSFANLAQRYTVSPPADARVVGTATLDGQALDLIDVPHGPAFDHAVVRERLGLDRATHLVRYRAMFTAERKVFEIKLHQLRIDPVLTDADLAL